MNIQIRHAEIQDAAILFDMMHDKAHIEGLSTELSATAQSLKNMIERGIHMMRMCFASIIRPTF